MSDHGGFRFSRMQSYTNKYTPGGGYNFTPLWRVLAKSYTPPYPPGFHYNI